MDVERNCYKLLLSVNNITHAETIFNLLLKYEYCKPTNVILGSLVEICLKK